MVELSLCENSSKEILKNNFRKVFLDLFEIVLLFPNSPESFREEHKNTKCYFMDFAE